MSENFSPDSNEIESQSGMSIAIIVGKYPNNIVFLHCFDILLDHMLSCPEEKMPIMMLFDEGMAR